MLPWIVGSAILAATTMVALVAKCREVGVSGDDLEANSHQIWFIYAAAVVVTLAMTSFGVATYLTARSSSLVRDSTYLLALGVGPALAAAGILAVWIWLVRLARTRHDRAKNDLSARMRTRPN